MTSKYIFCVVYISSDNQELNCGFFQDIIHVNPCEYFGILHSGQKANILKSRVPRVNSSV